VGDLSCPILYNPTETDFNHNGCGILGDCASCLVTEEANGAFELSMQYPMDGIHFEEIQSRSIIKAKPDQFREPQLFRVYKISKPNMSGIVNIDAQHISYDLSGVAVQPFTAESVQLALSGLRSNAVGANSFNFWTDKSTAGKFTVSHPASIRSRLGGVQGSILDVYGGEYEFDNFTVQLHNNRGMDRGVSVRYGKNLVSLKQEENCQNIATGIYPYWQNQETGAIVQLPEKVVNAPGEYDFQKIRTVDFTSYFETEPTEEQLRNAAGRYIQNNEIGVPIVSLDVSFVQLQKSEEYKHLQLLERVSLFDTLSVEFPALKVSARAKAVKIVYNVLLDRVEAVTLGSVRANIADTIVEQQKQIEQAPTKTDLQLAKEAATAWLTNGKGYAYFRKDASGNIVDILFMDTQDPSTAVNVMRVGQSGIGFSSSGVNGEYESAWTIDGNFLANFITTGQIKSQNGAVVFDLNTGTMTINGSKDGKKTQFIMSASGVDGYSENSDGEMEHTLSFDFGAANRPSGLWNPSWNENTGFTIGCASGVLDIGTSEAQTKIYGSTVDFISAMLGSVISFDNEYLYILGKAVSWKPNSNGTFTLIGQ
jgi:phage minor structural protein